MPKNKQPFTVQEFLANQIIGDTFNKLKEVFKPEQIKGRGVVNPPELSEQEISKQARQRATEQLYNDAGFVMGSLEKFFDSSEFDDDVHDHRSQIIEEQELGKKYKLSTHEAKAIEVMKSYIAYSHQPADVQAKSNYAFQEDDGARKIINQMECDAVIHNIDPATFRTVLLAHEKNNFTKFSDAAILRKK